MRKYVGGRLGRDDRNRGVERRVEVDAIKRTLNSRLLSSFDYLAGASPDLQATILHFPKPVTTSLFPSSLKVGFCRTNVQT